MKKKSPRSTNGKLDLLINKVNVIDTRTQLTEQTCEFIKERVVAQEEVNVKQDERIRANEAYRENLQGKISVITGIFRSKPVKYVGGGGLLALIAEGIAQAFGRGIF